MNPWGLGIVNFLDLYRFIIHYFQNFSFYNCRAMGGGGGGLLWEMRVSIKGRQNVNRSRFYIVLTFIFLILVETSIFLFLGSLRGPSTVPHGPSTVPPRSLTVPHSRGNLNFPISSNPDSSVLGWNFSKIIRFSDVQYRVTHKWWDFRDDCTEFILSVL